MAEKYDSLVCDNCGYDGGAKYLQENLEWERSLSRARQDFCTGGDREPS